MNSPRTQQNTDRYRQRVAVWKYWSRTAEGQLSLRWIESGGPPVTPPSHRGFGSRIMENIVAGPLKGEVRFDWRDQGLMCEIVLPLA